MATTTTISQVGEFPLISSMVGDLTMGQAVTLGPGDDGAVFQVDGSAVVSTDVLVEEVVRDTLTELPLRTLLPSYLLGQSERPGEDPSLELR